MYFRRFDHFIAVQQQLEALFVATYIAAGKEFAKLGRPDLVQVAAQIGSVEAEHGQIKTGLSCIHHEHHLGADGFLKGTPTPVRSPPARSIVQAKVQ